MRNLDAFLNIASNACLIARLFVQSLVMSDPHHNYEKKAGSLRSNLDGGLPLGILCCYGWHTGASCFLHRLSGNRRDSEGTLDFWRTNTAASGLAAEPVFSSVSMTRNESERCTAQWVTGGNWDSSQREWNRTEQSRTGGWCECRACAIELCSCPLWRVVVLLLPVNGKEASKQAGNGAERSGLAKSKSLSWLLIESVFCSSVTHSRPILTINFSGPVSPTLKRNKNRMPPPKSQSPLR